jgi:glutathione S-transferase
LRPDQRIARLLNGDGVAGFPKPAVSRGRPPPDERTLAPAVMKIYEHAQLPDEKKAAPHAQDALGTHRARLSAVLDVVGTALARNDFLATGHFTAADLSMASILHLANHLKALEGQPRLVEYVYLHCKRPACSRAVS